MYTLYNTTLDENSLPSRTQQTVPKALKALTLQALRAGSTQMAKIDLIPPCLAINLHRWLPSRARVMMESRERRSEISP